MRRIAAFIASAVVLAVPAAAFGYTLVDDGTLTVTDGYGTIQIGRQDASGDPVAPARGALVGSIANGTVTFTDPVESDTNDFQTNGCDRTKTPKDNTIVCSGSKIRYRVVGGPYRIKINGEDIDLSAVGRGTVTVNGAGPRDTDGDNVADTTDNGKYRLNDADWKQIPDKPKSFQLEH
jgi:hypothetical protein